MPYVGMQLTVFAFVRVISFLPFASQNTQMFRSERQRESLSLVSFKQRCSFISTHNQPYGSVNLLLSSQFTRIGTLRFRRKKKRSRNSAQNNDLVQLKAFLDIHHCSFRHWDSGADFDAVEVKPSSFQGLSFPQSMSLAEIKVFLEQLIDEREGA